MASILRLFPLLVIYWAASPAAASDGSTSRATEIETHLEHGRDATRHKDYSRAEQAFRKALELLPAGHVTAHVLRYNLARVVEEQRRPCDAQVLFDVYLKAVPHDDPYEQRRMEEARSRRDSAEHQCSWARQDAEGCAPFRSCRNAAGLAVGGGAIAKDGLHRTQITPRLSVARRWSNTWIDLALAIAVGAPGAVTLRPGVRHDVVNVGGVGSAFVRGAVLFVLSDFAAGDGELAVSWREGLLAGTGFETRLMGRVTVAFEVDFLLYSESWSDLESTTGGGEAQLVVRYAF